MSTPLKKTIAATCLVIFVVLAGLLILCFRQYQTMKQQQGIVEQTEQLNFQYAIIREHIIESTLNREFEKFPDIAGEMEELKKNISRIIANAHIPDEYKLSFMNQIDIAGTILLLRQIKVENPEPGELKRLNQGSRILGERLMLFDRMIINYARQSIFALQSIIIGTLALSVFILVFVLTFLYRRMAIPIMSLARQTADVNEGMDTSLSLPPGCAETDALATFTKSLLKCRENGRAEILRASQLASLGELAGDVSHEINNLSNGIINYAQILSDEENGSKSQERDQLLSKIIKEGEKIAAISSKLLSYSTNQTEENEPLDLNRLIEGTLSLNQHRFRSDGIQVVKKLQQELPGMNGNAQHIKHLLLNLLNNARYALNQRYPLKDEKKILEVESGVIFDNEENVIRVAVTDLGPGIPPQDIDHVFEPDFSTKPPGTGSGLGLSISREIARNHNGKISVESKVDDHTTIRVDFPLQTTTGTS